MAGDSEKGQILGDLTAMGFSEPEAHIYTALIVMDRPVTAYELAKGAQIPVANTYNVMRSLEKRGASKQVSDNPARYVATPPADLFLGIAEETNRRCHDLISRFEHIRPPQSEHYVEVFSGQQEIEKRVASMFADATENIVLKGRSELAPSVQKALADAVKRGVTCYFIYYGEPPVLPKGDVHLWPHEGNGWDIGKDFLTVSVDFRAAIASHRENYTATFSENHTFVYLTDVLLRHEVYLAEIMTTLRDEVEEHFGPALYKLREKYATMPVSEQAWGFIRARLNGAPPAQDVPVVKSRRKRIAT